MSDSPAPMRGLRTVIYGVPDLTRAEEWDAKAFETEPYFDEPFYVGVNIGGFELGLHPDSPSGPGGATAYWGVENADEAIARLSALGATVDSPPSDVGGGIKVATVLDPFGNQVGIIENPHFDLKAVR